MLYEVITPEKKGIDKLLGSAGLTRKVNYYFFSSEITIYLGDDRASYSLIFADQCFLLKVYYSEEKAWGFE